MKNLQRDKKQVTTKTTQVVFYSVLIKLWPWAHCFGRATTKNGEYKFRKIVALAVVGLAVLRLLLLGWCCSCCCSQCRAGSLRQESLLSPSSDGCICSLSLPPSLSLSLWLCFSSSQKLNNPSWKKSLASSTVFKRCPCLWFGLQSRGFSSRENEFLFFVKLKKEKKKNPQKEIDRPRERMCVFLCLWVCMWQRKQAEENKQPMANERAGG